MKFTDEFRTGAEVVDKRTEPLWGRIEHPVTGASMVECPTEVSWLRNSSSKIFFLHGGEEVTSFSEYTDFYGPLTDVPAAIQEAVSLAERFSADPDSSGEVVVITTLEDVPALPASSSQAMEANAKFLKDPKIKRIWRRVPDTLRTRVENEYKDEPGQGGQWRYPSLSSIPVSSSTIWTSKRHFLSDIDSIVEKVKKQYYAFGEIKALEHV